MVVGLVAFLFQDWQDFLLALSVVMLPALFTWLFMPESPRWLVSRGKMAEAKEVLRKGAKMNGRGKDFPEDLKDSELIEPVRTKKINAFAENSDYFSKEIIFCLFFMGLEAQSRLNVFFLFWVLCAINNFCFILQDQAKLGFRFLFSDSTVSLITLVQWANWVVVSMAYYGLGFTSVNLSSDPYISFVLSALIEIPSYLFCLCVLDGIGRKPTTVFSMMLAGVCCLVSA